MILGFVEARDKLPLIVSAKQGPEKEFPASWITDYWANE